MPQPSAGSTSTPANLLRAELPRLSPAGTVSAVGLFSPQHHRRHRIRERKNVCLTLDRLHRSLYPSFSTSTTDVSFSEYNLLPFRVGGQGNVFGQLARLTHFQATLRRPKDKI